MPVIITGATGFIGRHLTAELTRGGREVVALMRRPEDIATLRNTVVALGGDAALLRAEGADLDAPDSIERLHIKGVETVVHLGARFAWGLAPDSARRTNVEGALAVAALAQRSQARLVMVSGFMLENHAHLRWLGIDPARPTAIDWPRVHARVGAYEASKLEAALRVRALAAQDRIDYVEVQPATVSGHSHSGALDAAQPLFSLIDNLACGRLAMVPGSPAHWLPLVAVDAVAALIALACRAQSVPERLLALDPATPNLAGLLAMLADELAMRPPRRHIPIGLLRTLLRVPGLARAMRTEPESLHFLQPQRYDTSSTDAFRAAHGLEWLPVEQSIRASARAYRTERTEPCAAAA